MATEKKVRVSIDITRTEQKKLRLKAANECTTVKHILEDVATKFIAKIN